MKKKLFFLIITIVFSTAFISLNSCFAEQLEVHFINVGQADSELIIIGDHAMLIDGGNPSSSQLIYAYLKQLDINHLDYIVSTHSDADHIGGLPAAVACVEGNIDTVLAAYQKCDKERFVVYQNVLHEYGLQITVPEKGAVYTLGDAEFQVLFPGSDCPADRSIVLRLTYGENSFIFTGDATVADEFTILADGEDIKSDVLKVGHHGSNTSTSYEFLDAVQPYYAVITCGAFNAYGHPTDEVLFRLEQSGASVLRSDLNGHIVIVSDGYNLYAFTQTATDIERNPDMLPPEQTLLSTNRIKSAMAPTDYSEHYVLNIRSMKFHLPDCEAVTQMSEQNKKYVTDTRENLISQGYQPCNYCRP